MKGFCYVYILQSQKDPEHYYVGSTDNLEARLFKHNNGQVPHTSKFTPWQIRTAIAFRDRKRAASFERYLKTASGRTLTRKRL